MKVILELSFKGKADVTQAIEGSRTFGAEKNDCVENPRSGREWHHPGVLAVGHGWGGAGKASKVHDMEGFACLSGLRAVSKRRGRDMYWQAICIPFMISRNPN